MKKSVLITLTTLIGLIAATWGITLFARGYRVDLMKREVKKTGILAVRSYPDGAKIYLNGKLATATNDTLTSLEPGKYRLEIKKEGFFVWEKEVEVFEELVTDVDALLISLTPRLEPLTQTGVAHPALSSSRDKIAYFATGGEQTGIRILPLSWESPINLFRTSASLLIEDSPNRTYSVGEKILWSPDDSSLLIKMNEQGFYEILQNQPRNGRSPTILTSAEAVLAGWGKEIESKRRLFIEKKSIPEDLAQVALDPEIQWSPDEQKFLFKKETEGMVEYRVYSLEDPLPVGSQRETLALRVEKDNPTKVVWFSDSNHLILTEGSVISLIEIDGSNQIKVFSGNLASEDVFPTPSGDKLIILITFNPQVAPNLYALGLR